MLDFFCSCRHLKYHSQLYVTSPHTSIVFMSKAACSLTLFFRRAEFQKSRFLQLYGLEILNDLSSIERRSAMDDLKTAFANLLKVRLFYASSKLQFIKTLTFLGNRQAIGLQPHFNSKCQVQSNGKSLSGPRTAEARQGDRC